MEARNHTDSVINCAGWSGIFTRLTLLDVDSRNGALYCQICDDLVWDPTLEELRLRKIGTGSFSGIVPLSFAVEYGS